MKYKNAGFNNLLMNNTIPYLRSGDLIQIVAPAKAINKQSVEYAQDFFVRAGYRVKIGEHCLGKHHYFAGTDAQRTEDFQKAIEDPEIKAIICARGGYGSVRIIDSIQWAGQIRSPKWIIGYSDITVFHQHIQKIGQTSIHATMPLNFIDNTPEALSSLLQAMNGTPYTIETIAHPSNKHGMVQGEIIGGNLSVLCSLIGTDIQPNYANKILFVEDVEEELYAIDRMFFSLKKAGILDRISGLIVGGMTNCKDTITHTIGMNIEEIVLQHFSNFNIPICFDFPAGHIKDNRAIVFGEKAHLIIDTQKVVLNFPRE